VHLDVIVHAAGNVDSAKAISGPAEFFSQAENLEAKRKFKPFSRDGIPVRASFSDWVSIVPLEKWADTNTPFPEIKDYSSLKMRLERTECYGACPAYSIEVKGDGSVDFIGKSNVLMIGRHRGQIPKQAVDDLLAAFRQANYFSLRDSYVTRVTDNPTYRTSIEFDGLRKSVRDYVGVQAGMPDAARDLEEAIDRIADTEKWIKGNGATASALVSEKYDFSADSDENRVLFANVVSNGRPDLIQLFVSNHAPALSMTKEGQSALASAAAKGDLALVKRMLAAQSNPPAAVLSCALGAAARSGNLELTPFLLEKGGLADGPPCGEYEKTTILMDAVMSGKVEIVKEILDRHPEINASTERSGLTALSYLFFRSYDRGDTEKIFSLLLASGANVNSRDREGRTPRFYACGNQHPEAVRLLVAAGADLN
jgi:ankyrin repeat protein